MLTNSSSVGLGGKVRLSEGFGLILVFFASLVLNISVCIIIWTTKPLLTKPSNIFVGNLCIANLLLTSGGIPFSLTTIIKDQHGVYARSILCQGNGFVSVMSSVAIVMTLCCICLDRYIAVTRPTRYKVIVTIRRSCAALMVVWSLGLLHASFPLFGWSKYVYHQETLQCSPKWTQNCSLYIYLTVIGFAFPIILMIFTYIRIVLVMHKHARKVLNVRPMAFDRENKVSPHQSLDQNLTTSPRGVLKERVPSLAQEINRSEGEELVFRSEKEIRSIGSCNSESTVEQPCVNLGEKEEQLIISSKLLPGNPSSDASSSQKGCQGRTLRAIFKMYLPRKQRGRKIQPLAKEWKVAKTGVSLLVIFVVLWLPYIIVHTCTARFKAPQLAFRLSKWLVFMNGVINPIAYAFGNSRVAAKFNRWLSTIFGFVWKCRIKKRENHDATTSESI